MKLRCRHLCIMSSVVFISDEKLLEMPIFSRVSTMRSRE